MKFLRLFALLFPLIFVANCQKKGEVTEDTNPYVRLSFEADIRSFDPRIGIDYPSVLAIKMLFEGLMRTNPQGKAEPAIAKSYTLSDNHKIYTFFLKDTKWSNGDLIRAEDFAYAWRDILNPDKGSNLGAQNLYPIKNARAIICREKPLDSVGIKVINDKTLQIELEHPTPYFLDLLSTPSLFPVNARVDREKPNWMNQTGTAFVCNGPFTLKEYKISNRITVVKNPLYWDKSHVKMPGIHIAIIKDSTTQLNMFEKDQLEWFGTPLTKLPLDAINYLKQENKIRFSKSLGVYWYFLNTESFPFQNKKMRKAFAYALNRKALTEFITQAGEAPAMSILPYHLATQNNPYFEDNNLLLAQQLFDEALEEMGFTKNDLPQITISSSESLHHFRISEAVQQQWNEAFDLNIALEKLEWKVYYSKLQKGDFQFGGMGWMSWFRDPIYIMQTFREKGDGLNMCHWENEEYQRFLSLAEEEIDPVKRNTYFNRAEAILMEEMPIIPLHFTTNGYAKSDRLEGVYISDLYDIDFRWSYFNQAQTPFDSVHPPSPQGL